MASPNKRRSTGAHQLSVEEQALNMIAKEAESREATSNAVLAEARKIRTHELERIRKEQGDDGEEGLESGGEVIEKSKFKENEIKDVKNANATVTNEIIHSKSVEELPTDMAQLKLKLDELELKYKKVMMSNAQLDNERHANQYQIELLKDQVSDLEEEQFELKRQLQHLSQDLTVKTTALSEATTKCQVFETEIQQRDDLIKANGLMLVSMAGENDGSDKTLNDNPKTTVNFSSTLLSVKCLQVLSQFEGESLGEKLQNFFDDKLHLVEENKRLQHELETEKSRFALAQKYPIAANEPASPVPSLAMQEGVILEVEMQRSVTETKLKLKKAEQEITTLQGAVTRLESQVNRYKVAAEAGDKAVEELKLEKRRLQKEMREAQVLVEDLETKNSHLLKRLEKNKTAKT